MSADAREQFGPVAQRYLTSRAHAQPDEINKVLDRLALVEGTAVDVGTGAGHLAYALAERMDQVLAVDITPQMLEVVAAQAAERGLSNVTTRLAPAEDMGLVDESVSLVATRLAAHHFLDVDSFVADASRSLEHGGLFLVIDTMSPEDDEVARQVDAFERLRDPSHAWNLKPSEWTDKARANGLEPLWHDVRRKSLDFDDWTERMRVSAADTARLRTMAEKATDGFRDYLAPRMVDGRLWFDLLEISFAATKP